MFLSGDFHWWSLAFTGKTLFSFLHYCTFGTCFQRKSASRSALLPWNSTCRSGGVLCQPGLHAEQLQQGLTLEKGNPWLKMETGTEAVILGSAFGELGSSSLLRNAMPRLTAGAAWNSSSCMFHWGTLHMGTLCNLKQAQYSIPESQWSKKISKGKNQREVSVIKNGQNRDNEIVHYVEKMETD